MDEWKQLMASAATTCGVAMLTLSCAPPRPAATTVAAEGAGPQEGPLANETGPSASASASATAGEAGDAAESTPASVGGNAEVEKFDRPAHWPEILPTPDAVPLANSMSEVGAGGDIYLRHWVPNTRGDQAFGEWVAALERSGALSTASCHDRPPTACSFQFSGRFGHLSISTPYPGSESTLLTLQLGPPDHTPIQKLPGACVTPVGPARDVTVHSGGIDQEGEYRSASIRWRIEAYDGPDLDGDGVADRFVPTATPENCPWSIPHDVYIMRGACGHKVGTVVGHIDEPTYVAPMKKGIRTIHTRAEWAEYGRSRPEPIHHTVRRVYTFDGRKLVLSDTDKREGVCHHCGVASCQ